MSRLQSYLNEDKPTMKLEKSVYGKHRVIRGYGNYDKLYVVNKGKKFGYCIVTSLPVSLDNMVEIDGEYWFGTLKEIKKCIGIG